ncbi:LysR family transcriptional regulator [Amycolatopsis pithecellobii]|uniref:LysR family transcriptional regulator n=1 Tax=Amycolatopsis pithecellobii TaxID=664692 RepID=A0A6N7Z6G6_9PSEU|nr:LysR family transcriptional regulator [Amycolatopsis pithecellobii]MTD56484.1 LysR family transcriptional regulator [Amycolatopsis pithecellobii]
MDLIELRELRYFVAVAEELHFGRAAQRLSVAQPAVSKTIRHIEARLGTQVFSRTSRKVELTPAGAALLEHGRLALQAVDIAVQSAQRAGTRENLRLVLKPGGDANLLSSILACYASDPDACQVEIIFDSGTERADFIRDGRADVALLYAPFDDLTGLDCQTLHTEDRVAVLPASHRLANRRSIRLAELETDPFPHWKGIKNPGATGPAVTNVAELIPLVAIGRVVAVLPRSLISPTPSGLACIPVEDTEPSLIVVARADGDDRPTTTAFVRAALRAATTVDRT